MIASANDAGIPANDDIWDWLVNADAGNPIKQIKILCKRFARKHKHITYTELFSECMIKLPVYWHTYKQEHAQATMTTHLLANLRWHLSRYVIKSISRHKQLKDVHYTDPDLDSIEDNNINQLLDDLHPWDKYILLQHTINDLSFQQITNIINEHYSIGKTTVRDRYVNCVQQLRSKRLRQVRELPIGEQGTTQDKKENAA